MRLLLALGLLASGNLLALTHPNFSGTWTLDLEESDFAGQPAPKSKVETIQHDDPNLTESVKQVTDKGDENVSFHYTTDGKPSKNTMMGTEMTAIVKWDGQDLMLHSTAKADGSDTVLDDRWTLSLDQNKLTVQRHFEGHGIRSDQMLVYRKQQ